jgi:hypothetical protein
MTTPEPYQPPRPRNERPFGVRVELDAGPFADVVALSSFERALARVPNIEGVDVRRLDGDRAGIEITLSEPAPLLAAMRASLPYSITVRSASRTALVLDVAARPPA